MTCLESSRRRVDRVRNQAAQPRGPAQMVYRDTPAGGWIFNASSIAFNGALFHDAAVARIVRNLMDDAVGRSRQGERVPSGG